MTLHSTHDATQLHACLPTRLTEEYPVHMPMVTRQWSAEELRALPDDGNRYEIVDGELFVTPAPAWQHQDAVGELFALLRDYLRRVGVGHAVMAPADVMFSTRSVVQPDLFVVPLVDGRWPERFEDAGRLLLAVEVLSPGTARADRVKKRTLYREQGVPDYWIVDLDARTFERSTPEHARPEILVDELTWHPDGAGAPLVIDLSSYFAAVLPG